MKIQKFNESLESSLTEKDIFNHIDENQKICKVLTEYLCWKKFGDLSELEDLDVTNFYYNGSRKFRIEYFEPESNGTEVEFVEGKDYDEMLEFLSNPNLFLQKRKYNL